MIYNPSVLAKEKNRRGAIKIKESFSLHAQPCECNSRGDFFPAGQTLFD
jgi:hypothetical protein